MRLATVASGSACRSAWASSTVRFLRRFSSSSFGPPGPKRSLFFWISMRLAPNAWRLPITLLLKPVTMATMTMTVVTPTTMPRMVRLERSVCSRMAPRAKRTLPPKLRQSTLHSDRGEGRSLMAQRLHRGKPGRRGRGGQASQQSRDGGRADDDEGGLHLRREVLANRQGHQGPAQHASGASQRGQERRLQQELAANVAL